MLQFNIFSEYARTYQTEREARERERERQRNIQGQELQNANRGQQTVGQCTNTERNVPELRNEERQSPDGAAPTAPSPMEDGLVWVRRPVTGSRTESQPETEHARDGQGDDGEELPSYDTVIRAYRALNLNDEAPPGYNQVSNVNNSEEHNIV